MRRTQTILIAAAGLLGLGTNTLLAQANAPLTAGTPMIVTNRTVSPAYTPQITRTTVAVPQTTPIPVPLTPEELAQTNALAASQRAAAWRPTPIVPPQPQNLIANQLRRPPVFTPPPPSPFFSENTVTNQPFSPSANPVPASTNVTARVGSWQQPNPLLRGLRYHW